MKVICVDSTTPNKFGYAPEFLKDGKVYNKINEIVSKTGVVHYHLAEDSDIAYESFRFIEISEISETELAEQRELQTV